MMWAKKREKVIGHLYDCLSASRPENLWVFVRKDIVGDAIALLKEQEPKTGKWVLDDEDANSWECSECGSLQLINDGTPHENDWYFCPHCGSKLEE